MNLTREDRHDPEEEGEGEAESAISLSPRRTHAVRQKRLSEWASEVESAISLAREDARGPAEEVE